MCTWAVLYIHEHGCFWWHLLCLLPSTALSRLSTLFLVLQWNGKLGDGVMGISPGYGVIGVSDISDGLLVLWHSVKVYKQR